MSSPDIDSTATDQAYAERLVAHHDTGSRNPQGWQGILITATTFIWALFQLYISSNLPFQLSETLGFNLTINTDQARFIHLAFAIFLSILAFPLFRSAPRHFIPVYDWVLAIIGVSCCLYLLVFRDGIAVRAGIANTQDLIVAAGGLTVLAISVYRALGLPLVIVAGVFLLYVFFGHLEIVPDAIRWKGASFSKAMWHFWIQTEGVFGVALGVSASMIFLFVLLGAILEKSGAGNYFVKLSFALLGHFRGGPAKAAVMASAMSGIYSGSSIANTVTTGTFTIPLMKRTGFSPEKAGAVEVASSTNGQLTPPVMGAAAFLISEFTGVSYPDIIRHALIPAIASYIALVYIVHLEALKLNLEGLPKHPSRFSLLQKIAGFLLGFIILASLAAGVHYGLGWIKVLMPEFSFIAVALLCCIIYIALLWMAAKSADLVVDSPDTPITSLPAAGATALTGLFYLLPIVILIWCIMIERLSPSLSAFWATVAMITISLTQHPLKFLMRLGRGNAELTGTASMSDALRRGAKECFEGMIAGSRNMIGIGVATGAAGVIVGTISLTGAHQVVGEFVEFLSGGNLMLMLILVAIMSLILGMGLPTTANYIVVSSLMAPVIVALGAKSGLIVPLIAVHLFVFYFGILADDTPPVGLAAFAAAAISGGDPIRTGIQGFMYDIRTAILPFLFIFNTELLLIDVGLIKGLFVFLVAVIAMMLFAAATQGYFLTRNRIIEGLALLLVVFTLLRPGFWLDRLIEPYEYHPGSDIAEIASDIPANTPLRLVIDGPDFNDPDRMTSTTLHIALEAPPAQDTLPAGERSDQGIERIAQTGLFLIPDDQAAILEEPLPGSAFVELSRSFDFYGDEPVKITSVALPKERPPKELFYLPALLILAIVILLQRRRMQGVAALPKAG
ncbi:TRAP transporter permease [Thioalkalivibrio sp. HK1]|uniref:TRAP transporter permease n=1 Tax=Thioalkalivibrio sp. HK1 TaxID=1469245 RepID=UPI0004BC7E64|nr:TRAP transporter permease [Thioalkalivibrio sp. HK1]